MKTLRECFPAVAFGTSGVRALVSDLTPAAVSAYVVAFVDRAMAQGALPAGGRVVVGIDLRPSSPAIAGVICATLTRLGFVPEFAGPLPTPALALRCLQVKAGGVMVTGSHIPFDRNGIKFYLPSGEIMKEDEAAISAKVITEDALACRSEVVALPGLSTAAVEVYQRRYLDYFGADALRGLRAGLYEHSAVGRDVTRVILESLGATVVPLGRSETFVPIDTEAVSAADLAQAKAWCKEYRLDVLVSTDGDGDRPLVFDELGGFIRGDLLGLICAQALSVHSLVVPVSCNTAIEKSGVFDRVVRTRIGSPYVIAGMKALVEGGLSDVAGFEANGGFLLGTSLPGLTALPTRDAVLPMVTLLAKAARRQVPVSALVAELPPRVTHGDRIKDIPTMASARFIARLMEDESLRMEFFGESVMETNTLDGLRVTFVSGDVVHLRPSGNAPELRCYAEAGNLSRAMYLVDTFLARAKAAIRG